MERLLNDGLCDGGYFYQFVDLIDKYGADAIRFTMLYNTSQGQDVHFSEKLLEMGRNSNWRRA